MGMRYGPKDQLAFDVLVEFGIATSQAITDLMGEEQAEALVRAEMRHAGLAIALNIKERMHIDGQSVAHVAYAANWINTIWGLDHSVEIVDDGFRDIVRACPYSRATSALCCHIKYVPSSICDVFAPGYSSYNRKRLSQSDDCCEIVVHRKGQDPEVVLHEPCTSVPLPPPLDLEERTLWNHSYTGSMWTLLLKSVLEEAGLETTMRMLQPIFSDIGRRFADRFLDQYQVRPKDIDSVVEALSLFHASFLKRGILARDGSGSTIRTEECPYSGEPPGVCELFQCFYDGLLLEIDPELEMRCLSMMTRGDRTCQWTIGGKGEAVKEGARSRDADVDEMLKKLKWRLTDGEISPEQYRQLRDLLLEK